MRPSNLGRSGAPEQNSDDSSVTTRNSSGRRRVSYEIEHFKATGLPEGVPAVTISQGIVKGEIQSDELCDSDISILQKWFTDYIKKYPEDTEVQTVNPENIDEIAIFIVNRNDLSEKYKMLQRQNPEDEALNRNKNNILDIIRLVRERFDEIA